MFSLAYKYLVPRSQGYSTAAKLKEGPKLTPLKIKIPRDQMTISYNRSSGPGGQNVNKRSTKAEVRFNPTQAEWLPSEVKIKFVEINSTKLTLNGELIVTAQQHRTQPENEKSCLNMLQRMVDDACFAAAGLPTRTETKVQKLQKTKAKLRYRALKKVGLNGEASSSSNPAPK